MSNWFQTTTLLDEVDSTNSYIQRELMNPHCSIQLPWLLQSKRQTAGRGRNGNKWLSDENSLTFSIAWQSEIDDALKLSLLPLHVGIAIADAIKPLVQKAPKVKWPNDIMLDGKKLAGILIESFRPPFSRNGSREQIYIVGVGVNCAVKTENLESDVAARATSVRDHLRSELVIENNDLCALILESIQTKIVYAIENVNNIFSLTQEWARYCFLTGRYVSVKTAGGEIEGECQGIDETGAIVLRDTNGQWQTAISGQVTRY